MKRYIRITILFLAIGCIFPFFSFGQLSHSGYFLEGSFYRHNMNPSFMGERNYISMPGLGNLSVGAQGNVGLSDFIYKYDDPNGEYTMTTFMSSTVNREDFLSNLQDKNHIQTNLDLTLLSFGFYGFGGYNTFGIDVHTDVFSNMPYELFDFMKTGMSGSNVEYRIRDLRIVSDAYTEIAMGHAHRINDRLTIGVKLKLLLGGARADANIHQLDISASQDKWKIIASGSLDAAVSGASFETEEEIKGDKITGFDTDDTGLNGWGLGTDLGVTYELSRDLTFSGALLNLGFISWDTTLKGITMNDPYLFDGFEDIAVNDDDDNSKDFGEQLNDMGDDLSDLAKFYDQGEKSGEKTMLTTTLNLAVEYKMPFYRKLSAGFLWSTQFNPIYTWSEARISANIAPVRWFDCSVNVGVSNLSTSLGWMMNFHPGGLNFFIGSDQMIMKVNSQYIPLNNLGANISMGLNIPFGKRRYDNSL